MLPPSQSAFPPKQTPVPCRALESNQSVWLDSNHTIRFTFAESDSMSKRKKTVTCPLSQAPVVATEPLEQRVHPKHVTHL